MKDVLKPENQNCGKPIYVCLAGKPFIILETEPEVKIVKKQKNERKYKGNITYTGF